MLTRSALEELYERLEKPLYCVLYRSVWDREEAHELVQETFLRLWAMREKVRMETVEPLAYRIGTNLASNRRRSRRLWQMVTLEAVRSRRSDHRSAEENIEQKELRKRVRRAILSLPERLRRVILLCEYSGLSTREIAFALGIAEGTVASRRHSARRKLRQALGTVLEPSHE